MLLDAFFRSDPNAGQGNPENPATPLTGENIATTSGMVSDVFVSPETAMKLAAVYSCIYVISSNLAQMPLHVLRREGKNVRQATEHPVFHLVHDEPNPWETSYKWRELMQRHVLGWGNAYTEIKRNRRGEVIELAHRMPWESCLTKFDGRWRYAIYTDEGSWSVHPDDMFILRRLVTATNGGSPRLCSTRKLSAWDSRGRSIQRVFLTAMRARRG